jgi:hypothetical protein
MGPDLVAPYGDPVARYTGTGRLMTTGGAYDCSFQAVQLHSGRIILMCHAGPTDSMPDLFAETQAEHFEGRADDGGIVAAVGPFNETNTLSQWRPEAPGYVAAYMPRQLSWCDEVHTGEPHTLRAHLTNLDFFAPGRTLGGRAYRHAMELNLRLGAEPFVAWLVQTVEHESRLLRLQTLRGTGVTAYAYLEDAPSDAIADTVLRRLSYVLSVARGTKVQVICVEGCDMLGQVHQRVHRDRVTKDFSGLPLIDPRAGHQADTRRFVETALASFATREERYELPWLIDAYLDARTQDDFLEMRGAKVAVACEALKSVLVRAQGPDAEFVLPAATFEQLSPSLSAVIRSHLLTSRVASDPVRALSDPKKLRCLNRRSFRSLLNQVGKELSLSFDSQHLERFIESRNCLVHSGQFLCQKEHSETVTPFDEYVSDLHFLDRIFAKLLGWDGPIIDWRDRTGETKVALS